MFKKEYDSIDDLNDISYVNPEVTQKDSPSLIYEIISDSFFNILAVLLLILMDTINLMFVGHFKEELIPSLEYSYFNFYGIGITYFNLFGFVFALGMVKTLKRDLRDLENNFLSIKLILIFLTIFLILPLCVFSYEIFYSIYGDYVDLDPVWWYTYTHFILFLPIFSYFHLLLQLNLKIYQIFNEKRAALLIFFLFFLIQIVLNYLFLVKCNFKYFGIFLSLAIASFICYMVSNINITENIFKNNFNFYPDQKINFYYERVKVYVRNGLFVYLEYAGFGFTILIAFLLDENSLTTNLILINLFAISHIISKGFTKTLQHYIYISSNSYRHSHLSKKRYVKTLSLICFSTALIFSIAIIYFNRDFVKLFLRTSDKTIIEEEFLQIIKIYYFLIFLHFAMQALEGCIRSFHTKIYSFIKKIAFLVIFLPLGIFYCFYYDYGLYGIWLWIYAYVAFFAIANAIYVCRMLGS